jgi:hypothetical protein
MTIISRLNTTVNNHAAAANIIAFGLLASMTIVSAAAINYSGDLAKASYDDPFASATIKQPTATPKAATIATDMTLTATSAKQTMPLTASSPKQVMPLTASAAKQNMQGNAVGTLQPAQGANFNNDYSATSLQPSANVAQMTAEAPQNASSDL